MLDFDWTTPDRVINLTCGLGGALIGSLLTIAHNRAELRRAERLEVAARVYQALRQHARNTKASRGLEADSRALEALVALQPWHRRRAVRRRVQAYGAACAGQTQRDGTGQRLYLDPAAIDRAIAALLPDTGHR